MKQKKEKKLNEEDVFENQIYAKFKYYFLRGE